LQFSETHSSITTANAFASSPWKGSGEVTGETLFEYHQHGQSLWASYQGGAILHGALFGVVAQDGSLDFTYTQLNTSGEVSTGHCHSTPELLPDGRIRLHESWFWTTGRLAAGTSIVEEVS